MQQLQHFILVTVRCKDLHGSGKKLLNIFDNSWWDNYVKRVFQETVPSRKEKPQREREADARTFGWIWLEKVRVGDASGRNCRRRGGRTGKMKMRANMQRYRETYMKM